MKTYFGVEPTPEGWTFRERLAAHHEWQHRCLAEDVALISMSMCAMVVMGVVYSLYCTATMF